MTQLNLTAHDEMQKIFLEHFIPIVSDVLAEKINNGVIIEKDGKRLFNKKDLDTFMCYLAQQSIKNNTAIKLPNGMQAVGMEGDNVLSSAIHYFEEDSIEGKLYNEDGTEYQPPKPVYKPAKPAVPYTPPKPKPEPQLSMFDMLAAPTKTEMANQADDHEHVEEAENEDDGEPNDDYTPEENEEPTEEEIAEVMEQEKQIPVPPPAQRPTTIYQRYLNIQNQHPDYVIVLRLGDFYEIFGQNAVSIAKDLDLTLTGRDNGLGERVPMIGVPYHASENYFAKMNAYGYKLAIVENVNTDSVTLKESALRVDTETGEILPDGSVSGEKEPLPESQMKTSDNDDDDYPPIDTKAFDPEALSILDELFGESMTLR